MEPNNTNNNVNMSGNAPQAGAPYGAPAAGPVYGYGAPSAYGVSNAYSTSQPAQPYPPVNPSAMPPYAGRPLAQPVSQPATQPAAQTVAQPQMTGYQTPGDQPLPSSIANQPYMTPAHIVKPSPASKPLNKIYLIIAGVVAGIAAIAAIVAIVLSNIVNLQDYLTAQSEVKQATDTVVSANKTLASSTNLINLANGIDASAADEKTDEKTDKSGQGSDQNSSQTNDQSNNQKTTGVNQANQTIQDEQKQPAEPAELTEDDINKVVNNLKSNRESLTANLNHLATMKAITKDKNARTKYSQWYQAYSDYDKVLALGQSLYGSDGLKPVLLNMAAARQDAASLNQMPEGIGPADYTPVLQKVQASMKKVVDSIKATKINDDEINKSLKTLSDAYQANTNFFTKLSSLFATGDYSGLTTMNDEYNKLAAQALTASDNLVKVIGQKLGTAKQVSAAATKFADDAKALSQYLTDQANK